MDEKHVCKIKAGAMKVSLAAPIGLPLAGCRTHRISVGEKDELCARAVVIEGELSLAIVSVDTLAIDRSSVARIRKAISQMTPIPADNVLLCATHTHTAAATVSIFDVTPDQDYLNCLEKSICGAVIGAWNKREDAIIKHGIGKEEDISYNRRVILKDGRVIIGGLEDETPVESILRIEGVIDPEVNVITIENKRCDIISIIYGFACHADIVTGNEYSADFPFYVEKSICRLLNRDDIPVLMLTGAGADINHLNVYDLEYTKSRSRYYDQFGLAKCLVFSHILASEIVKTALKAQNNNMSDLYLLNINVEIPLRKPKQEEIRWATSIYGKKNTTIKEKITADEIFRLQELQRTEEHACLEIQIIRLGEIIIIGIPCEVFSEIGLRIKQLFLGRNVFVSELTNGYEGYMITEEAYRNGGYEAQSAFSSKLSEHASKYLLEAICNSKLREMINI